MYVLYVSYMINFWWKEMLTVIEYNNIIVSKVSLGTNYSSIEVQKFNFDSIYENINFYLYTCLLRIFNLHFQKYISKIWIFF